MKIILNNGQTIDRKGLQQYELFYDDQLGQLIIGDGLGGVSKMLVTNPIINSPASAQATGVLALGNGTATSATAGSASALPATPYTYLIAYIGAQQVKIPVYKP